MSEHQKLYYGSPHRLGEIQLAKWRSADYVKKASRRSQEDIFNLLKRRIPSGAHHVSGGLPDARGLSDVDIYLPRKRFTGLEQQFPKGTTVTKQGDDYAIYSIPGFKREVNVYATSNPAKRESIDHRRTMMALASKYPQAERRAFAIKQKGKGSEPAWAEVLGLQGDPYEVMRDTDKVMRHASTMKLASKRFRHRAGLIIRDDQGRILVSEASPERVAKGISRVSLPGGGIHDDENETRVPTKREIIRAARKEALEELGMRIRNPRVLGSHSGELEDWWKDQQEKKRGVRFDGAAEHFVLASPGRKDMSLYNVEGDAFPGKYRDMAHLAPLMEQDANRDSAFAQFNKKQLELIKELNKKASFKQRGVKTASFRDRIRSIEIPPEFGKITDRYYQTQGQGELIAYGNNKYTDYHNPKRKRARSMEDTYRTKTAEKTKRRMSHVDPDKYNDNFRLGQMIGTGAAGMSLGAAIGGLRPKGTNRQALGGALLGAGAGALLGNKLYRRKSDAVVYNATKRTPRHRVKDSLLADIENVDPALLRAPNSHFMTEDELKKTAQKGVATKTDPAAWARAKAQARAKMGGKHSARAMQLATQIYKKNGGGYRGAKPSSGTNKLKKWTKQKWQWSGKDTPGPGGTGVYLPKRSSEQLKSTRAGRDKLRAASAAKRAATNSGRQFSSHGLHVGKKRSDVR